MLSVLPLILGIMAGASFGYLAPEMFSSALPLPREGQGYTPEVGAGLRWTAFAAFAVFLVPLYARSIHTLLTSEFTKFIMRQRRNVGVVYGGIQIVHISLIAVATNQLGRVPGDLLTQLFGTAGLVMILAMTFTSFPSLTNWLTGNGWRRIHKTGMLLLVSIYIFDFVGPFLWGSGRIHHAICASFVLGGIAVRVLAVLKKRRAA